jgi:hypothetical protein
MDALIFPGRSHFARNSLGARASGPHVFKFHGGHFISKRLCDWDMRTGGPRTQPTHPGSLEPPLRISVIRDFAKSTFSRAIALCEE